MKLHSTDQFVVGNKVFFIKNGVPHTAMIDELYENLAVVTNITFLDKIYDKRTHGIERWEVNLDQLIKTDQFYFPYHPTIQLRVYIAQLMHNVANDFKLESVRCWEFLKKYTKKTLEFRRSTLFFTYPENFIKFSKNTIIFLKDEPGVIYRVKPIFYPNKRTSYWLEKYVSEDTKTPISLVKPNWSDTYRNPPFPGMFSEMIKFVNEYENSIKLEIEIRNDITIESVEKIYHITDKTLDYYFNGDIHKSFRKNKDKINIIHKYYNLQYEKEE